MDVKIKIISFNFLGVINLLNTNTKQQLVEFIVFTVLKVRLRKIFWKNPLEQEKPNQWFFVQDYFLFSNLKQ